MPDVCSKEDLNPPSVDVEGSEWFGTTCLQRNIVSTSGAVWKVTRPLVGVSVIDYRKPCSLLGLSRKRSIFLGLVILTLCSQHHWLSPGLTIDVATDFSAISCLAPSVEELSWRFGLDPCCFWSKKCESSNEEGRYMWYSSGHVDICRPKSLHTFRARMSKFDSFWCILSLSPFKKTWRKLEQDNQFSFWF